MITESNDIPDEYWDKLETEYNLAMFGYLLYIPQTKEFSYATEEVSTSEEKTRPRGIYSTGRGSKDH